jgi:hypothetical protein
MVAQCDEGSAEHDEPGDCQVAQRTRIHGGQLQDGLGDHSFRSVQGFQL